MIEKGVHVFIAQQTIAVLYQKICLAPIPGTGLFIRIFQSLMQIGGYGGHVEDCTGEQLLYLDGSHLYHNVIW